MIVMSGYFGVFGMIGNIRTGRMLVTNSEAFSYLPPTPRYRVLFLGDSTAVGTGAADPANSLAGRFHIDHPAAAITNMGENGLKVEDALVRMRTLRDQYDLIVLQVGANDILYFSSLSHTTQQLNELLTEAQTHADNVVLITSGNIGLAPFFTSPDISRLYSFRSKRFLDSFEQITTSKEVLFVDLYTEHDEDPFNPNVEEYYAADKLHLNDDGYRVWYENFKATLDDGGVVIPQ